MAPPGAYYDRGPSPWLPAIVLGVILLVATTPFRMAPDVAMAYHPGVRKTGSFIPPGLIWIPVIVFLLIQFFGGSNRSYGYGRTGLGRWYSGSYGDGLYPGGDPYDVNYIRYNGGPYADRPGVLASLMDYGGYWLFILLGIWLFSLVGPGAMSPRFGFPWSPQPQVVMPIL